MGGSKAAPAVVAMAEELGARIARRGWVLLTGGRNQGVMAAASRGAKRAGGTVIGILPDTTAHRASPDLDFAILTGMGDARNLINVLSSDVVIACPGKMGTLSEIALALNHARPVILLGFEAGPLFDSYIRRSLLTSAASPADAITQTAAILGAT
ncbi:MAG: LOG family protein [Planctomycetes bacterium]|nr:LOG family protein [Planctomycetota bacterium]